jgi:hypothetical protein
MQMVIVLQRKKQVENNTKKIREEQCSVVLHWVVMGDLTYKVIIKRES